MKQSRTVSALLALCFGFGLACGSGTELAGDGASSLDETVLDEAEEADVNAVETAGDIGAVEQAITMPVVEPGGAGQQCVAACTRVSATDLTGVCCVCNGALKKFGRGPTSSIYLCK